MALLVAYGRSQARGQIRAVAVKLCHSHSSTRTEMHLQPTPQLIMGTSLCRGCGPKKDKKKKKRKELPDPYQPTCLTVTVTIFLRPAPPQQAYSSLPPIRKGMWPTPLLPSVSLACSFLPHY